MERLTRKTEEGIWAKEFHGENVPETLYPCYGGEPNANYSNCEEGYVAMEKLWQLENAEEEGLLIRLPCKVGDILYKPTRNFVSKYRVAFIEVSTFNNIFLHTNVIEGINDEGEVFDGDSIGKTVFLTEKAAAEIISSKKNR